jgi:Dolichyl-phosphate-mannose-protein mannosyltransferase
MPNDSMRLRTGHKIALAAILTLAAALRAHGIGKWSLSPDELGSMSVAAGRGCIYMTLPRGVVLSPPPLVTRLDHAQPIWDVPENMSDDVHPPIYFILLRLWQDTFGGDDASSRALSAVAGVIGVGLLFDVGRLLAGVGVGLWASLLMAVAEPQILYSQDARPYMLALVFILAAADALLRMERFGGSRRRSIAFCSGLAFACLTHYFTIGAIAAMGIYALVQFDGNLRRRTLAAFVVAAGLFLLLWGYGLWLQRLNFSGSWMYWFLNTDRNPVAATLERAAVLPLRYLAEPPANSPMTTSCSAVLYLLPWLLCYRQRRMILLGAWLLGCTALVTALDLFRNTDQLEWIKYTLCAAPAVYLILPMLARGWARHFIAASALVYCLLALPSAYRNVDDFKGDFKGMAADLDRLARADEPVIFARADWGDWHTGSHQQIPPLGRPKTIQRHIGAH